MFLSIKKTTKKINIFLTVSGWHLGHRWFHIFQSGFQSLHHTDESLSVTCWPWVLVTVPFECFLSDLWHNRSNTRFGPELGLKAFCSKCHPARFESSILTCDLEIDTDWYRVIHCSLISSPVDGCNSRYHSVRYCIYPSPTHISSNALPRNVTI